jgi:hypothetical protein
MIITAQLMGGIGNQMFQIAAAKGLTLKLKDMYPEDYKDVKCVFDFNKCDTKLQGNVSNKYKDDFFRHIQNKSIGNLKHKFKENGFKYSEIPPIKEWAKGLELFGYFQSSKYFNDYRGEIINLFHFSEEKVSRINEFINSVDGNVTAVHVRRGDYLNNPGYHPTCSVEYYKEAMKRIGESNFIFISDDIEWCKENFKGDNIYYSPFTSEIEDLTLITNCDNQIIANSSFSWWGAYLCKSNGNTVIGPKIWFGPKGPQDTHDVLLKNWIKI